MSDLERLMLLDERSRQIAGLYTEAKARADALEVALRDLLRKISSSTGGSIADLIHAVRNAEKLLSR